MASPISALEKLNKEEKAEYWACLALRYGKNIGARSTAYLLKYFNSAFEAVHNTASWGETKAGSEKALHINDNSWRSEAKIEWDIASKTKGEIILWTDPRYPKLLKEIPDPPSFFYALGNVSLLNGPLLAIVGSRTASKPGEDFACEVARSLSYKGITIVSGMAKGIDRAAHVGALKEVGSTITVLGSGINVLYPIENKDIFKDIQEKGLVISDFPPNKAPDAKNFPVRNRIISGISLGVLIVEAGQKSGSRITASLALEQNRAVYAVPGAIHSPYSLGCQDLIRQGAKPIFHVNDILEDLLPQLKDKVASTEALFQDIPQGLNAEKASDSLSKTNLELFPKDSLEYALLLKLGQGKIHIDSLCQELNIPASKLLVLLTQLELNDHITRHPGGWVSL